MGQIKAVYPSSYRFRQEKNIPTYSSGVKKSEYQLTLEPVLGEGTQGWDLLGLKQPGRGSALQLCCCTLRSLL